MSAGQTPLVLAGLSPKARFISARRVRRCFADGLGATLILESGDALVIAEDVVRLLGRAIDHRDERRQNPLRELREEFEATYRGTPMSEAMASTLHVELCPGCAECTSIKPPALSPPVEGTGAPLWVIALGISIVAFLVFGVLGAVDGLATRWLRW